MAPLGLLPDLEDDPLELEDVSLEEDSELRSGLQHMQLQLACTAEACCIHQAAAPALGTYELHQRQSLLSGPGHGLLCRQQMMDDLAIKAGVLPGQPIYPQPLVSDRSDFVPFELVTFSRDEITHAVSVTVSTCGNAMWQCACCDGLGD